MAKRGSTVGLQKSLLATYRKNISKRREPLPFELSFEEFQTLIFSDCYICGAKPSNVRRHQGRRAVLVYNGIDRVDNTRGYVSGNVKACCAKCNSVKSTMCLNDLKDHLIRMLRGLECL